MPKAKLQPAPPPAPARDPFAKTGSNGLGPIVAQTKRQHHFDDKTNEIASALGFDGDPSWQVHGLATVDARNFIRKTLHEIHVAAANEAPCPSFEPVVDHFTYVVDGETLRMLTPEDEAELTATLTGIYDAEVTEFKALDPAKRAAKIAANKAEDAEARKQARIQQALQDT